MTTTTITALPAAAALDGTEPVPIDQGVGPTTVKTTTQAIANLAASIPINEQDVNYIFALTDAGKAVMYEGGGGTYTIPAASSINFPVGTVITVINFAGAGFDLTIAPAVGVSLFQAGTINTGNRTLSGAKQGMATLIKVDAFDDWFISGVGLT